MSDSHDLDPIETREWLDSVEDVIDRDGADRAHFLLDKAVATARAKGANLPFGATTAYLNTIPVDQQAPFPGDVELEWRIRTINRWNAMATVVRRNKVSSEYGGHIASFASSAVLYDIGLNHFWRTRTEKHGGDLVFFQGHAVPGIYARSFMEGRFTAERLDMFRSETGGNGLSSYPHPWLMPDYWQFPTVSMGLGPLMAIYQARFMKYMHNRGLIDMADRKVWVFLGDGEMDEPESLGAIGLAAREELDNLIFVVNCNLQRLDGPVRGNGKIIQELEGTFRGAGWNVIKLIWGSGWDELLDKDETGMLRRLMEETVDGDYQAFKSKGGAYTREHFFGRYPETRALVADMTDEEILAAPARRPRSAQGLRRLPPGREHRRPADRAPGQDRQGLRHGRGGRGPEHHPPAEEDGRRPAPRLPRPLQGAGRRQGAGQGALRRARQRAAGLHPEAPRGARRRLPAAQARRRAEARDARPLDLRRAPEGHRRARDSTTMCFVRALNALCRDKKIGKHVVPIVPDESRTFGMEGMFRQLGIYNPKGQLYTPEDADQLSFYKESKSGQVLQEGINEAGAMADWIAAATSYSVHGVPMIPFYIYYSMFGFQRIGDLAWAAGDSRARGFLLGGTAGRTTLNGEGLQHQDGHSQILAGTIPNCISYDPTFGYEIAVIVQDGLRRMFVDAGGRLLLPDRRERKLPPSGHARGQRRGDHQGALPILQDRPAGQEACQPHVLRLDLPAGHERGGDAEDGFRRHRRPMGGDEPERARPRGAGRGAAEPHEPDRRGEDALRHRGTRQRRRVR